MKLDFGKLKQDILNLEKEIIEKYPPYSDGKTGLGNNSLTSRFKYYNLLQMDETKFLKEGKELGNKTENGSRMFIYQASEAFKLWHGIEPEVNFETFKLLKNV